MFESSLTTSGVHGIINDVRGASISPLAPLSPLIDYHKDSFQIKCDGYQSDHYSDLNELRLQDLSIIREDLKHAHIPFDIYVFSLFNKNSSINIISRKSISFKVDTQEGYNVGEYWIVKLVNGNIVLKWAVFDYDMGYLFINNILKCSPIDIISAINEIEWKDFAYDNGAIQWLINTLNEYCRKNIKLPLPNLGNQITDIIWSYIVCPFSEIEF